MRSVTALRHGIVGHRGDRPARRVHLGVVTPVHGCVRSGWRAARRNLAADLCHRHTVALGLWLVWAAGRQRGHGPRQHHDHRHHRGHHRRCRPPHDGPKARHEAVRSRASHRGLGDLDDHCANAVGSPLDAGRRISRQPTQPSVGTEAGTRMDAPRSRHRRRRLVDGLRLVQAGEALFVVRTVHGHVLLDVASESLADVVERVLASTSRIAPFEVRVHARNRSSRP